MCVQALAALHQMTKLQLNSQLRMNAVPSEYLYIRINYQGIRQR